MHYAGMFLMVMMFIGGCIASDMPGTPENVRVVPTVQEDDNQTQTPPVVQENSNQTPAVVQDNNQTVAAEDESIFREMPSDTENPPLLLKTIGITVDAYDPATGKAGDLVFTKNKLQFDVLFSEYGFTIPASMSASGQNKRNPQPTFIVPLGTNIRSLVDGVVVGVPVLYSGDYSIQVASTVNSRWRYETEHVINPLVKVGDTVKAGQIIAQASPHSKESNAGYGLVEIGLLKGGNPPQHICPFAYLDPSVREDTQKKLLAFYNDWEEYRGDTSLYDEAAQLVPGCLTLEPIDG